MRERVSSRQKAKQAGSKKESAKSKHNQSWQDSAGSSLQSGVSPKALVALLLVSAIIGYVIFGSKSGGDGIITFSRADQPNNQLVYKVNCSTDYNKEPFYECKPKHCGRVVMDNLVTEQEAAYLLNLAKKGLVHGGSSGGASILDLHSGALSQNDKFINIYRMEKAVFTDKDFSVYGQVKDKIHRAIADYFEIPVSKLYLTKPTFFSRMNTTEAKTKHDEYWHPHVDKVTYGSFHYTSLLYLTTYNQDFTGGRFTFVDKDANRTVEPRIGRVSFFTSGSENLHFVEKLESGVRYAITISFTCDPTVAIADPTTR